MRHTLYEQLGGEGRLRAIIERFVDRIFEDPMIGFFFARASRERIKDKEFEFAAAHLGGPVAYSGRPIGEAHAPHPIMGGHFMRRLEILRQTLVEFGVPRNVLEHWIAHTEKLRPAVTSHRGSDCSHEPAAESESVAQSSGTHRELPIAGPQASSPSDPNGRKGTSNSA